MMHTILVSDLPQAAPFDGEAFDRGVLMDALHILFRERNLLRERHQELLERCTELTNETRAQRQIIEALRASLARSMK